MTSEQELENWAIQTDILILENEYQDWLFRKKSPNHKCNKNWYDAGDGRWFCKHLENGRNRNKELNKKWKENLLDAPWLNDSKFLRQLACSLFRDIK